MRKEKKRWAVTGRVCEGYLVWRNRYDAESAELASDEIVRFMSLPQDVSNLASLVFPSVVISGGFFLWLTFNPYYNGVVAVAYNNGVARVVSFVEGERLLDEVAQQVVKWQSPQRVTETNYSVWYIPRTTLPMGDALLVAFATKVDGLGDEIVRLDKTEKDTISTENLPTPLSKVRKYKGTTEY